MLRRLAALLHPRRLVFFKPSLLGSLSWGRRHAPPPLRKRSFLSLPSTRRLRRFGQLAFHTSLARRLVFYKASLLAFLSWGRRHAPPPLRKRSFLSLPSTRRLRRF